LLFEPEELVARVSVVGEEEEVDVVTGLGVEGD
jgi:hypothetical protein